MTDPITQAAQDCGLFACNTSKTIEDLRNIGLIILGLVGLGLAGWRSWLAHQSTMTTMKAADMDRFQKGAQMLGDPRLSVRQAGVIIFEELAKENPKRFATMCQKTLEQFILDRGREDTKEFSIPIDENIPNISADAQSALEAVIIISQNGGKKLNF